MSTIEAPAPVSTSASRPNIPTRPCSTQESRIRVRLLHSLGIEPKKCIQKRIRPKPIAEPINYFKTVSTPFLQPLQDSMNAPRATSTFSASFFSSPPTDELISSETLGHKKRHDNSQKRTVRFDDEVLVVPIPSRHAYSDRIRRTIWRNASELRDIVDRNRYEYTFEGWESTKVLEDDDMYVDIATGEKVHPCWVENGDPDEEEDEDGGIANPTE